MILELKRGMRNHYFVLMALISVLNVLLGYILLVTIDELEIVTFSDLWESVYTVYTQFGTLLFSTIMIMQFYRDYKEKNIIFYKALKKNALSYFCSKLAVLIIGSMIGTFISSLLICIPYAEYKWLPIIFLKTEAVMIYYCIIMSLLGFVFENFLLGFFVSFTAWIVGIVISDMSPALKYFAYYDAARNDYKMFIKYIYKRADVHNMLVNVGYNYVFDLCLLGLCVVLVILFSKRWKRNGI